MIERVYTSLDNNGTNIFVFGSNKGGYHGAGAALTAYKTWGAIYRKGNGRQGQSYGIPTKDHTIRTLPLADIQLYVDEFLNYAMYNIDLMFLVTRIGCGYAGYKDSDIAPMFKIAPANCILPVSFSELLRASPAPSS